MSDQVAYVAFIASGVYVGACSKEQYERTKASGLYDDVDRVVEFTGPVVGEADGEYERWLGLAHAAARAAGATVCD